MKKMSFPNSFKKEITPCGSARLYATFVLWLFFGAIGSFAAPQNVINNFRVTGSVTDAETGLTLPGVNVIIEGTLLGTTTKMDGSFELDITEGENLSLIFSFIGYEAQTVAIDGRTVVNVALLPDNRQLDEVVVVGYGTQKRVNLSGAVDQIRVEDIQRRPLSSLSQGLQGVIPNLNIDFNEGSPGAEPTINIRGFTSINEGEPLILIDGIPSSTREMTRLEPQDVESISVLKDAASAAIYGARASFGVILIQTKQGSREGMNINYTSRVGWDKPTVLPNKTSDPYIYMRLQDISASNTPWNYISYSDDEYLWAKQRSENPTGTPAVREDPNNPGTWQYMGDQDWINYFLSDYGFSTNHTISLDGRNEKTSYYLSGSYDR
jgi:TonB-dependent SusC/RagA subfamily outer membrane receptor